MFTSLVTNKISYNRHFFIKRKRMTIISRFIYIPNIQAYCACLQIYQVQNFPLIPSNICTNVHMYFSSLFLIRAKICDMDLPESGPKSCKNVSNKSKQTLYDIHVTYILYTYYIYTCYIYTFYIYTCYIYTYYLYTHFGLRLGLRIGMFW